MQELVSESLHVVGEELAVTFNDVRSTLELYADGGAGPQTLERCLKLLHSANGVLRMTETYGASLLTEEMEATLRYLERARRQDGGSDEALEALSRAAVQLPAYVELIINGGRDIPLVLLPLLNDLRAARGKPLLSESTLLLLNIAPSDDRISTVGEHVPSGEDIAVLCRELRPRFQLALLGWIKGDDVQDNLKKLGEVAERLERAAVEPAVYQLWWVVTGIIEALRDGGLESSVSLKRLMGQADREMKRLPVVGARQYAGQPPTELINNFLYYIARSTTRGERVTAVRAAFDLSDLVSGNEQVYDARASLGAPSTKLMQTVSQAIRDDLARVKDVLDIYVRTGMEHVEELVPQIELLKKIGDTLGVLGLGELREIIRTKRGDLQEIIDAGENVEESALIEMASALLSVEDRIEADLFSLVRPEGREESAGAGGDDKDYGEVTRAVMRECVVNLARIKDAVAQILEHPRDGAQLDAVPAHLRGIIAGLMILEKDAAVSVVEEIGEMIDRLVQSDSQSVDTRRFDLLADAIVSLEYYLETMQAGRKEPLYMLDNARDCLQALRESERGTEPDVTAVESSGMTTTMQIPEYEPTVVASRTQVLPGLSVLSPASEHGVDPELLELFIEEAREEIDSINRHFPLWADDEANHEALITVRRSFHTLKGSGRMVGAERIGEYCWSIEDLLNRLINRTIETQPACVDFLGRAIAALPELLEQLEVGEAPEADIEGLMAEAAGFLQPHVPAAATEEPADVAPPAAGVEGEPVAVAADETPEAEAGAEPATAAETGMDPVLLEILSKETRAHLEVIEAYIADCADGVPPFVVTEELYRACHTLHGSVTMANAEAAVEVTQPLNSAIRRAYDHELPIDENAVAACADTVSALVGILAYLSGESAVLPDTDALQVTLWALDERIEAQVAEAETRADETLPPVSEEEIVEADARAAAASATPAFDPEIAEIFAEEAAEILEGADAALKQRADGKIPVPALEELQRFLHTLKGGARMAGLMAIGDFSHDLETLLVRMAGGTLAQDAARLGVLQASVDELHRLRDQIEQGILAEPPAETRQQLSASLGVVADEQVAEEEAVAAEDTASVSEAEAEAEAADEAGIGAEVEPEPEPALEAEEEAGIEAEPEAEAELEDEAADGAAPVVPPIAPAHRPVAEQLGRLARELDEPARPGAGDLSTLVPGMPREPIVRERREFARVDPGMLENLLNNAGEVSIFHSRLSQQLGQIQFNLEELGQTVIRLREQLRNLEMATEAQIIYQHQSDAGSDASFDPLSLERYSKIQQLSRALAETTSDVGSIKDLLQNQTADTEALLVQQARTAAELQDGLMRTRMVPFEQHTGRLSRLVRQMGSEHGKRAELVVQGSGDIDRQVLEKMVPALEHMIRNAVIHGIEAPDERAATGKPEVGRVSINLRREGSQIVLELADDGRGMDIASIRRKATDLGLIPENTEPTDEEVLQFVLRSGFSTADRLTHAAGRGVGMDVVASEIAKLGGTLHIDTEAGAGTTFTVFLPYTLAVTQALIVRAETELYAIPLPTVEGIIRISRAEFDAKWDEDSPSIEYGGQNYQLRHLGPYLGLGPASIPAEQDRVSIILVRAGDNSTALVTDEMLDSREVVVKPVGGQLATIRGISGATILGDGRIVVILDVGALVRMTPMPAAERQRPREAEPMQPLALVVDDSITMRRVTQRLLERNNMRVLTAKDGVEAVGMLQDHRPDIILLDIEMPRMDGYEFATHVRNNPDTAQIPIIMVTSRVSENHKARAIELGVNDYLGKPYQENALLEAVRQLLDPRPAPRPT